jgi:hypothetical protein
MAEAEFRLLIRHLAVDLHTLMQRDGRKQVDMADGLEDV